MTLTENTPFLRQALLADAAVSGATGLAMAGLATTLSAWLALPAPLLLWAGVAFLPYAATLAFLGSRDAIPTWTVWAVIAMNVLWAADCVLLLMSGWVQPVALGKAFVLLQAGAVALFAELQWMALRRAPGLAPRYA